MHSHDVRAIATWPPYTPLPPSFLKQHHKNRSYFPTDVAPIIASGGLDMNLVLAPAALPSSSVVRVTNPLDTSTVATFEDAYHRRIAYPQEGRVQVAKESRLVSCVREAGLTVWRIADKPAGSTQNSGDEDRMDEDVPITAKFTIPTSEDDERFAGGWEKVLEMDLKVSSNIVAHRISDDGLWLAISDIYETKIFRLQTDVSGIMNICVSTC